MDKNTLVIYYFIALILFWSNSFSQTISSEKDVYYINLAENEKFSFPTKYDFPNETKMIFKHDNINVNFIDKTQGIIIEDSLLLQIINKTLVVFSIKANSVIDTLEAIFVGDAHFKKSINTKIIFIEFKDKNNKLLKVLLGFNILKNQVVSIFKLSESVEFTDFIGFGRVFYSKYKNGIFRVFNAPPGDVTGKIQKKQGIIANKSKLLNNGTYK